MTKRYLLPFLAMLMLSSAYGEGELNRFVDFEKNAAELKFVENPDFWAKDKDIEYVKRMLSRENVQSTRLLCADTKGVGMIEKAWYDKKGDKRLEIEKLMLDGMRSFAIPVDIDGKPCAYEPKIVEDRGFFFVNFMTDSKLLCKEKEELIELVKYLGSVKISSMPTSLAKTTISGTGFFESKEDYKEYFRERTKQCNTARVNREIMNYRKIVIMICSEALPAWKKSLSEKEFNALVEQLAALGKMNSLERTTLEQRVISKDEWTKRVDAWWALPLEKREAM